MVEINTSNHPEFRVCRRRSTVDTHVRADMRTIPGGCEVKRVGENGLFPGLESNVGLANAGIFKLEAWI